MERAFVDRVKDIEELGVCIRIVGERERFSERFQTLMNDIEQGSQNNNNLTVVFCLSYGGRSEIVAGVNELLKQGIESVDEETFGRTLWTGGMPNPDIIIRTGGKERLSNFLTWQSVYSELFFTDTLWPDYSLEEFERHVAAYRARVRNFGV
jgi:undecaprenyl diphosphate synthase